MNPRQWELYAAYGGLTAGDVSRIMGDRNLSAYSRSKLLATALAVPAAKELARLDYKSLIEGERGRRLYTDTHIQEGLGWLERLDLERSLFEGFPVLPRYSFALELGFQLARPYLSRDDGAFYIIDNPVRKDKVLKIPFVAPASWKGSLRSAATRGLIRALSEVAPQSLPDDEEERDKALLPAWVQRAHRVRLFGNEVKSQARFINRWLAMRLLRNEEDESEASHHKRVEDLAGDLGGWFDAFLKEQHSRTEKIEGRRARLRFFPTFFDDIGLEIINPHDRQRRVGKNPILLECVPAGAHGTFRLLYVPYDFPGQVTPTKSVLQQQLGADLPLVAEAVRDLLTVYGFGAKTSSGFGVADPRRVAGELRVNLLDESTNGAAGPGEALVRSLLRRDPLESRLRDDFFADGRFLAVDDDEIKKQPWSGKVKADYRKVKPRVLELVGEQPAGPAYFSRPVTDLNALPGLAKELCGQVGGAG